MSDAHPQPDSVSARVAARVEEIVASAEEVAARVQQEVEAEAARRAHELRVAAEAEAERIRRRAEADARDYLVRARREVDRDAQERSERLAAISGELARRAEELERQFAAAETARRQLYDLIAALGVAASELATQTARPAPELGSIERPEPTRPTAADGEEGR